MRRFSILIAAACLLSTAALSSCTDAQTTKVDATVTKVDTVVQAKLNAYCPKLEAAHQAFKIATFFIAVPGGVTAAESTAYAAAEVFCDDPSTVSVATAPTKVLNAVDAIQKAHADATSS